MSLFGGDSSAPPTELEYESESDRSPTPIAQSPTVAKLQEPPGAQVPQSQIKVLGTIAEDAAQDAARNHTDSEESEHEEPERPNRFKGPPQTWKGYTAADRQIADSLQEMDNADLAAHLYNAHALKRRARKPAADIPMLKTWQNKDAWMRQGGELQYTDTAGQLQTELIPAKDWTAWPLPPASLENLHNGPRPAVAHTEDEWVIGGASTQNYGEEMKAEMLGLFLRLAKDNWNAKEWQDDGGRTLKESNRAGLRSRAQSTHSDVGMQDGQGPYLEQEEEAAKVEGAKRGRKAQLDLDIKPVILADDDRAQRLLRPTIASMLNDLDGVALALQRTRLNHFGRGGFGEGSSQSEFTTDAETTGPESSYRSQSRKSVSRSKPATRQSSRPSSSRASRAPKSPKKASKAAVDPGDSDSASDYGAQFAREGALDSEASLSPRVHRKRSRSESTNDDDMSNNRDWSRAGLMDWSEVLGIAAVKGWNQKALARTAERCAALFGESMAFMPFHEDLATNPAAELLQYTPSTIPAPGTSIAGAPRPMKRPYWQTGSLRCPHTDCYAHHKDFRWSHRTIEHCMRVHGYDPRTNDSDNEERQHGGIHIDGFLQPISAKQGWLGHGRAKAGGKKRKTAEPESTDGMTVESAIGEEAS